MSDQMPDEEMSEKRPDDVWTDGSARTSGIYMTHRFGAYRYRYIRADLYEQAEAERDRLRAALEEVRSHLDACAGDSDPPEFEPESDVWKENYPDLWACWYISKELEALDHD